MCLGTGGNAADHLIWRVRYQAAGAGDIRRWHTGVMRRRSALMGLLAVVVAGSVAAGQAVSAPERKPSLRLAQDMPPTVVGLGFAALERVRLDVRSPSHAATRVVVTTRIGTFRAVFPTFKPECPAVVWVSATGSKGSRARLKPILPPCGQEPAP